MKISFRSHRSLVSSACRFVFFTSLFCAIPSIYPSTAQAAEVVVRWDALKRLDELAEKCEALCEKKDVAGLREVAGPVKQAATVVATDAVPAGAKEAARVNVLQGDLKNLAESIVDPAQQDGEELTAILAGIHPIVEELMGAAGMPHVHEEDEAHEEHGS